MKRIGVIVLFALTACTNVPDGTATASQALSYAQWLIAPGGAEDGVNYGLIVDNNLDDGTLNYGVQVRNSSDASGTHYGLHVNTDGFGGANFGILAGATNGTANVALQTNHGDVVLNAQSGVFRTNATSVSLGATNLAKVFRWGHDIAMGTSPAPACGTGAIVTGTDSRGVITAGSDASSCVLTFSRTFSRTVTCIVTPRDGVVVPYAVSSTSLTLPSVAPGSSYDFSCSCVGSPSCT